MCFYCKCRPSREPRAHPATWHLPPALPAVAGLGGRELICPTGLHPPSRVPGEVVKCRDRDSGALTAMGGAPSQAPGALGLRGHTPRALPWWLRRDKAQRDSDCRNGAQRIRRLARAQAWGLGGGEDSPGTPKANGRHQPEDRPRSFLTNQSKSNFSKTCGLTS